jgi:hypothetical protein
MRRTALVFVVLFQDVERVAMVKLHAHRSKDGSHRASGAALLADDFSNVLRRNAQLEDGVLIPIDGLDLYGCWLIHKGPRDFADQFVYLHHFNLGHDLAPDLLHSEIDESETDRNSNT